MSDIVSRFCNLCKNNMTVLIETEQNKINLWNLIDKDKYIYTSFDKNIYFRSSKYMNKLKEYIENNDEFIRPQSQKIEFLKYINDNITEDFCVDENIKSLIYYDANIYVINKEIFHNVAFSLVMSICANLSLPSIIFCCGSVYDGPIDFSKTIERYSADSLRYYLTRSVSFGSNLYFNNRALIDTNNHILANFENLVDKCYKICVDVCYPDDPHVPPYNTDELENPIDIDKFVIDFNNHFIKFEIREAIILLEYAVNDAYAYIDYVKIIDNYDTDKKYLTKYTNKYLNLIYIFSHYYSLICPNLADYIINDVLLMTYKSFDDLHLSILPHNKKILKTDKISFITKLQ